MMRLSVQSALHSMERCFVVQGIPSACKGCIKNHLVKFGFAQRSFHAKGPQFGRGLRQLVNADMTPSGKSQSLPSQGVPQGASQDASDTEIHQGSQSNVLQTIPDQFSPLIKGTKEEEIYEGLMKMKPKEIFYLLQNYHSDLNKTHFALSMKRLHRIYRNLPSDSKGDYKALLHSQDGFKLLCALLALKGEYYEPPIVADMLMFMHELGLESSHPTMQVYLHLLSHNLHRLTLDVILKVTRCSVSMTMTSQVKLLRQGVKILAEKGQLTKGISVLSVAELVNMLDLIGGYLPKDDLKLLMKEISLLEENISPRLSVVLLKGLRHLGSPHYLEVDAVNKIVAKMEKLSPNAMIEVLAGCWDIDLYHFELLHKIESEALEKFDVQDQFRVLKWLYKFGYLGKKLMPVVQESSKELFATLNSKDLLILMEILSDGSHKMNSNEKFIQLLMEELKEVQFGDYSIEESLRCLTNLHVLGQGRCDLANDLGIILDNEEAIQHLKECPEGKHITDHPLWRFHMTNLVKGDNSSNRLESSILEFLEESSPPSHIVSMGNMIEAALQTENCVVTRPRSKEGIVIDHLICLDEKNQPVNLAGKQSSFMEDWVTETNHKIVSVMEMPSTCLHRNTRQLRGFYAWYMRQLQSRGHLVVLINTELFDMVEDHHKCEYIRRKIFSAENYQDLVLLS